MIDPVIDDLSLTKVDCYRIVQAIGCVAEKLDRLLAMNESASTPANIMAENSKSCWRSTCGKAATMLRISKEVQIHDESFASATEFWLKVCRARLEDMRQPDVLGGLGEAEVAELAENLELAIAYNPRAPVCS